MSHQNAGSFFSLKCRTCGVSSVAFQCSLPHSVSLHRFQGLGTQEGLSSTGLTCDLSLWLPSPKKPQAFAPISSPRFSNSLARSEANKEDAAASPLAVIAPLHKQLPAWHHLHPRCISKHSELQPGSLCCCCQARPSC